jgi:hypothetical protein
VVARIKIIADGAVSCGFPAAKVNSGWRPWKASGKNRTGRDDLGAGAEPFQGDVNLPDDLRVEVGPVPPRSGEDFE